MSDSLELKKRKRREEVYALIDGERDYQESLNDKMEHWGASAVQIEGFGRGPKGASS